MALLQLWIFLSPYLWIFFMNCRPSLHSQFLITGAFSSSLSSYVFVSSIFVTSISKLSNSVYLSWAFQLKVGFLKLLCHVSVSLMLAVVVDWGPTSGSSCHCLNCCLINYCPNAFRFCHFSLVQIFLHYLSMSSSLEWLCLLIMRHLLLTPWNVMSLKCDNTDVV